MSDKHMSPEQSRALEEANAKLQTAEGQLHAALHVATNALKYSTASSALDDATDLVKADHALRELIRWTAEYQKERQKSRGLEAVNAKWFDAWDAARNVLSVIREPGDHEHGSYQSVHYALNGVVKKCVQYIAVIADRGEGGIDERWRGE